MPVLQFKGKTAVENYHHTVPHHRLEFDAKLSLLGKGEKPALDGNLIIEGDNLLALKALLPTHAGKVKCIYIDPPYNTGNEGWVYNDNLTQPQFKEWIGRTVGKEGEDACRHDKWCCMMYPRLTLLRELLREDGSIWISIDDNEVQHLRMLMDELFGTENFVACICWQKKYSASNDHQGVAPMHDFLLVYSKSEGFQRRLLPRTAVQDKAYKNPDNDPRGAWKPADYTCNKTKDERPNLFYPIRNPHSGEDVWPDEKRVWAYSEDLTEENVQAELLWWGKDGTNSTPALKNLLSEVQAGLVPTTWWPQEDVGHTDEAKKEVQRILGEVAARMTPKPLDLLKRILEVGTEPADIVLDSFAGTGTTGHGALALQGLDGVRQFILVQQKHDSCMDEKEGLNICEELTRTRIAKAIQGYSFNRRGGRNGSKKVEVAGLNGTFSYACIGEPLFGEYKTFGDTLPSLEDIAKYVFYTETSHEFPGTTKKQNPAWDKKSGRIGEYAGRSYYLLYVPNEREDRGLDRTFLKDVASQDSNRELVVYCERLAVHQEELRQFEREHGKKLRPMLVPFNLK